ncbi:MAG: glycosyltransferase family 9 protein [Candidatus Micrarchaeota archaeon]|nr:glycosyltransferase family 9 protein [Candidatus Micrarchaeota archaeon]
MKILIIALSGAGDFLMSTPMIRELRLSFPKAKIDCLVMQGRISSGIASCDPDIDRVIYRDLRRYGVWNTLWRLADLRARRYDLSITTYPQAVWGYWFVSYLVHAKRRVGFTYDASAFGRLACRAFFTALIRERQSIHVVDNNMMAIKLLGLRRHLKNPKMVFEIPKGAAAFAARLFSDNGIRKAAIVHPGSGTTKNFVLKRWPAERFSSLCKGLYRLGYKVILVGGPEEESLRASVIAGSGLARGKEIFDLSSSIEKVAAVIQRGDLVVSNDSVIGHLAAAVGTRVVSIFGPTSEANTSPYTDNKVVVCMRPKQVRPFRHGEHAIAAEAAQSMNLITVADVLAAVRGDGKYRRGT